MSLPPEWLAITYEQALAAYEAGQKLHVAGRILLVRPLPHTAGTGPVLWLADEQTTGEHGLLLFPDGRVIAR